MARDELTPNENPYVGPRTFSEKDARRFFGREREARDLLSLVITEPLSLFYARSGAGKSSLINTRLIPGLRQEEFVVLPVTRVSGVVPIGIKDVRNVFVFNLILNLDQNKHDPQTLATETLSDHLQHSKSLLSDPSLARVLIIDQFEEIFTTHLDHWQERRDFFEQLAQAMKNDPLLWVVLSMREDYVASLDPFARMLPGRLRPRLFMQRMDADTALIAIEEPAEKGGRPFAPGVANTLVDNLRQIRGQTSADVIFGEFVEPVQLQVVCYQLWQNLQSRPQGEITQKDVDELGNVDEALGQFYEQAIGRVVQATTITELSLRNWFENQLITESRTRGTVYQGKENTAGMPNEAVNLLVSQFLIRSEFRAGGTWFELVHERFVEPILQANTEWRLRQSPLVQSAETWERAGRPPEKLYRGGQLRDILVSVNPETADEPVRSFLRASQDAQNERDLVRAQEEAEEERRAADEARQQAEKEAKTSARLRYLATALIVAFFLVAAASVAALWQSQVASSQSQANATLAVDNAAAAATAGVAVVTSDYFVVEANYLLQTAVASESQAEAAAATSIILADENADLAATSQANEAIAATRAAQAEQAKAEALLAQQEAERQRCLVSAQALASQAILTLSQPKNDTELAALLAVQANNLSCVQDTPDAEFEAFTENFLRDLLSRPYYNNTLRPGGNAVRALAFSPDGHWLAAAADNGSLQVYDLTVPGNPFIQLQGHTGVVRAVAFHPQTSQLASAGDDLIVRLWDLSAPDSPVLTLTGHTGAVRALAFSPDGNTLTSAGDDKSIYLWNLAADATSREPIVRTNHANSVFALTYVPTSSLTYLISVSSEGVYLWDANRLAVGGSPSRISSSQRFINGLAINRTGRIMATIGSDASVRLWDITNLANVPSPVSMTLNVPQIGALAFNPAGNSLFVGDSTGAIRMWDFPRFLLNPGLADASLNGHQSLVLALAVSANGRWLASATASGEIRLWQLQTTNGADLDYAGLLAQACQMVGRNLSQAEWADYLPGQLYQPTCANLPSNSPG
ncbi:MAG: WD40 repeat domain-containing protein [Chloroflexi bacterium]|nr:WD40 repeat domain-containing protein [Chloroflexota bacterium]